MTQQKLAEIERALRARRDELMKTLWQRDEILVERSADTMDELQSATMREQAGFRMDQESHQLYETIEAMDRIAEGSYGYCTECGGEIHPRRLAAVPWARLCLPCQQAAEARGEEPEKREPASLGSPGGRWMTAA